jgi:hypothetical protein
MFYKKCFISENGKSIEMSSVLGCGAELPGDQYPMFQLEIPYLQMRAAVDLRSRATNTNGAAPHSARKATSTI